MSPRKRYHARDPWAWHRRLRYLLRRAWRRTTTPTGLRQLAILPLLGLCMVLIAVPTGESIAISDHRERPQALYLQPVEPASYRGTAGDRLKVLVTEHVGLSQRLGLRARNQTISVSMTLALPPGADPSRLVWKVRLPETVDSYRIPSTVRFQGERITPDFDGDGGEWRAVDGPSIQVPVAMSPGTEPMRAAFLAFQLRGARLAVSTETDGDGRAVDLMKLQWNPPTGAEAPGILEDNPVRVDIDPYHRETPLTHAAAVQLTACASCEPLRTFAAGQEVDKDEYAVATNFTVAATLSWSTASYPWWWLKGYFKWIVSTLAGAFLTLMLSSLWRQVRSDRAPTPTPTPRFR